MNTYCYCHEPDHDVCWGFEPNPDCECCQQTLASLDEI